MFQTFNFFKFEQLTFFNVFVEQFQFEQLTFWSKNCICLKWLFWAFSSSFIFLASARTVSSSRDFGVEQFFWADEFRADDPSPYYFNPTSCFNVMIKDILKPRKKSKNLNFCFLFISVETEFAFYFKSIFANINFIRL